ncbi:hypothetical protein PI125_g14194 [Phytophthora idaei]|nr:hypothetical protein PI125_g14194 [Phytophthora idaei]
MCYGVVVPLKSLVDPPHQNREIILRKLLPAFQLSNESVECCGHSYREAVTSCLRVNHEAASRCA